MGPTDGIFDRVGTVDEVALGDAQGDTEQAVVVELSVVTVDKHDA